MDSGERYDNTLKIQRQVPIAETHLQPREKEAGMECSAGKENKQRVTFEEQYTAEKKAFEHSIYGYAYRFFLFILKIFVILQVILHAFLQFVFIGAAIAGIVIYWMEHYQWTLHGASISAVLTSFAMMMLLAIYRVKANYCADDASSIKYTQEYRFAEFTDGRMRVIKHKLFIPLLFSLRHIIYCAVDTIQTIANLAFMATVIMIPAQLSAIAAIVSLGVMCSFNKICAEDKGGGLLSHLKTKSTAWGSLLIKAAYSVLLLGVVYLCGILNYQAGYISVLEQIYIFLVNC